MSTRSKTSPISGSRSGGGSTTESSDIEFLHSFLSSIQLESFLPSLRDRLQVTRVAHFDYVKPKDLEKIGMSKPAIRRLLDAVSRSKKMQLPTRPPPPVPTNTNSTLPSQTLAKTAQAVLDRAGSTISSVLSNNETHNLSKNKSVRRIFE